ncbi:WXG100 family type VII secretion target [Streptomyces chattanoogensis]|uniref:WXG100 family type VII secretion target n=1 Tax=Streptomyces chattanoogensis TaxID=66876 RepID=UPI000A6212D6|nr:hypothetical protein [Streptomyces chattanoogensis]
MTQLNQKHYKDFNQEVMAHSEWGAGIGAESYKSDHQFTAQHTSKFWKKTLPELKAMVATSNPDTVRSVGEAWGDVAHDLDGGSSNDFFAGITEGAVEAARQAMGQGGGIKGAFDRAIAEVREHWDGKAAQMFEARAREISQNIAHAAQWTRAAGNTLENAASALEAYGPYVLSIEEPDAVDSGLDRAGDEVKGLLGGNDARDDTVALASLEQGVPTKQVLDSTGSQLSAGREAQLRGAIAMEYLGAAYNSVGQSMPTVPEPGKPRDPRGKGGWTGDRPDGDGRPPGGVTPPLPPSMTGPRPTGPGGLTPGGRGPGYTSPMPMPAPNPGGVGGGIGTHPQPAGPHLPPAGPHMPPVKTGLEGLGGGGGGGGGGGLGLGGGGGGTGLGGGGGSIGSGSGGVGGDSGGSSGTPGMPGGMGTGGAGRGAGTGRAGMPGMGGGAGAGGAKGKGGGAGRGSAMARQRGGVAGAAKPKSGAGAQGGSGLHRSRGGSQAGKSGGRGGMAGAQGAPGANGKKNAKNGNGNRPDYLVEEEETWIKQRNVVPRVIE